MKGQEDGGVRLECTSRGWFPEPRAVWRDPLSAIMPALEEAYTVDADGLFMVTTSVVIRPCCVRKTSCSVSNTLLGQEKETVIFIPESFAPGTFPWTVGLAVILPSLLLFTAGSICLIRKLHRGKEVENEEKEIACKELETDHAEEEKEHHIREQLQEELRWRRALLQAVYLIGKRKRDRCQKELCRRNRTKPACAAGDPSPDPSPTLATVPTLAAVGGDLTCK